MVSDYAVIYDVRQEDGSDLKNYYGYFGTPEEAGRMFWDALGHLPYVHNAYIVRLEEHLKPHLDVGSG